MKLIIILFLLMVPIFMNAQLVNDSINKIVINNNLETDAEFPGGFDSLAAFISKNVIYPKRERKLGVQGTVDVWFEINTDGKIINAKAYGKNINNNFKKEGLRVVRLMLNWKPATVNGKKVKRCFTTPFLFQL